MIETKNYIVSTRIKETWPSDQNEKIFFPSIEALDNFPNSNFPYKNFEIITKLEGIKAKLIKIKTQL